MANLTTVFIVGLVIPAQAGIQLNFLRDRRIKAGPQPIGSLPEGMFSLG